MLRNSKFKNTPCKLFKHLHVVNESSIYIVRIYIHIYIHKILIVYIFNSELKISQKLQKKKIYATIG